MVPLEVLNSTSFPLVPYVIYFRGIHDSTFMSSCTGGITELRVPYASGLPALYLLGISVALTRSLQSPCPTKRGEMQVYPTPCLYTSLLIPVYSDSFCLGASPEMEISVFLSFHLQETHFPKELSFSLAKFVCFSFLSLWKCWELHPGPCSCTHYANALILSNRPSVPHIFVSFTHM